LAVALIVAAGRGERLGADCPKALVELGGRPLVQWSIDALGAIPAIAQIVVALPAGMVALPAGVVAPAGTIGVEGGAVRSESVRNALAAAKAGEETVLIHDAARPLLGAALVERVLAVAQKGGVDGAIAATPVTDTVKRAGEPLVGRVDRPVERGDRQVGARDRQAGAEDWHAVLVRETLERSELWAVQTPQVFRRAVLERALDVSDEVLAQATDDAWLVERTGGVVAIVAAPRENLKVTTELDLRLAELLLARRPD
jgi:2-C-methyl-D-erythritol 4-phosphate cytidylyltransferase